MVHKVFYLLQKEIKLNIRNISVLINIFINLYDNSNIDCNKKIKINYMIYIIILFSINSFIVININRSSLLLIHVTTKPSAKHVDCHLSYLLKN